jgi:hypothetical protein
MDVAHGLVGRAHVGTDHLDQKGLDLPPVGELGDRDQKAFLVDLPPVGAEAAPADVDHMRGAGEIADVAALAEDGRDDRDVVQVPGAEPGVVREVDVALQRVLRAETGGEVPDAFGHGVDVARRARDRLRHHPRLGVKEPGGQVARLPHRGGKGGAHERHRLFLDHRDQAVPHDLVIDLFHGLASFRIRRRLPSPCPTARKPR